MPAAADDKDMFYMSGKLDDKLCGGYLRGDMGRDGKGFWHSWFDNGNGRKTPEFQSEFQDVMSRLRQGLLKDYTSMASYCRTHPKACLPGDENRYGFKMETENRVYYIRCTTLASDYFYVFPREKAALVPELAAPKRPSVLKQIRDAQKAPKPPRKEKTPNKKRGDISL